MVWSASPGGRIALRLFAVVSLLSVPTQATLAAQGAIQNTAQVIAQNQPTRNVSVVVSDADSNTPIQGAGVAIGSANGTTNVDGRLTLRVPIGLATVAISARGYFSLDSTLDVAEQDIVDARFVLARDTPFSTSVNVVAAARPTPTRTAT